ncbi:hypothetical protein M0L20_15540 [Spirosoma sp. RP8]|uniref:Uncharacterized protein n=1 Tax=Spirosoma liriopis TaxID=2937440 RepID=A0ABT0HP00_9BACT|nr:hypothetical protein [Spirosoma liriopis]MCK8493280.1 hypothetical protein [Spirosoma liriopis]
MKKHLLIVLVSTVFGLSACKKEAELTPPVDNVQLGQTLLTKRAGQLTGKWLIDETSIAWKRFNPYFVELGITQDTVLRNLATLTISSPTQITHALSPQYIYDFKTELVCQLDYGGKSYPVYLTLSTAVDGKNTLSNVDSSPVRMSLWSYPAGAYNTPIPDTNALLFRKLGFFHTTFEEKEGNNSSSRRWYGYSSESALGLQEVKLTKQ